ncbi:hypothetical protein QTI04_13010 [Variovorax sp. J22R115]|nr:hypothetical protein [Variovorax sp. J22R115]
MAQSYVREAKLSNGFATLTRVERSINEALTVWTNDIRPEGAQGNS